jgi:hypothetical protein
MKHESLMWVRYECDPRELAGVMDRLTDAGTIMNWQYINTTSITPSSKLTFFKVRYGPRVWNVAAEDERAAIDLWRKELGFFKRWYLHLKYRTEATVRLDREMVTLTQAGYKQKLVVCDFVQTSS